MGIALSGLLCSGCSEQKIVYSNEYIFGQDQQSSYYNNTGLNPIMADSKDGYYFINGPSNQYLFYKDKATGEEAPLCNKPDCLHNDDTCNGYIGMIKALIYYSGKIYYLTDGVFNPTTSGSENDALYEISLDGKGHKELLSFPEYVYLITMHRGYIYYVTTDYGTIPGKEDEAYTTVRFYRLPINKLKSKAELLYELQGIDAFITNLLCDGNSIYFSCSMYTDDSLESREKKINRYNILDDTIDVVLEGPYALYSIFNGALGIIDKEGVYLCDLDGHIEKIWDEYGLLLSNDKYLLIDVLVSPDVLSGEKPRTIIAIDSDRNFAGSIELDSNQFSMSPIGIVDNEYLVPSYNQDTQLMTIYQIPVDNIADGTGKPEVFFEYTE